MQPTDTASVNASFSKLVESIRLNGIEEPLHYVEDAGVKYLVNGHHRLLAAYHLGIREVPALEVRLPYEGYRDIASLTEQYVSRSRFLSPLKWMR